MSTRELRVPRRFHPAFFQKSAQDVCDHWYATGVAARTVVDVFEHLSLVSNREHWWPPGPPYFGDEDPQLRARFAELYFATPKLFAELLMILETYHDPSPDEPGRMKREVLYWCDANDGWFHVKYGHQPGLLRYKEIAAMVNEVRPGFVSEGQVKAIVSREARHRKSILRKWDLRLRMPP